MFNGKAILVFLCIFVAGGVTGHFVSLRVTCAKDQKKAEQVAQLQSQPRRPVEEWSVRFQKMFVERVGISDEQKKTQIDPLLQAAQVEFRRVRDGAFLELGVITEMLDAQVLAVLNDEQKPKYEELIKEREERFKKKEAERAAAAARGEPPPGPPYRGERPPPPPPPAMPEAKPAEVPANQSANPAQAVPAAKQP